MKSNELLVRLLRIKHLKISFAESCTGCMLSSVIIDIPGSSDVIEYSTVTYSDRIKNEILGVDKSVLEEKSAVSRECAAKMAECIRRLSLSDIGVSVTGYAGPDGDEVGLVYIGISSAKGTSVHRYMFSGGRNDVRKKATLAATMAAFREAHKL